MKVYVTNPDNPLPFQFNADWQRDPLPPQRHHEGGLQWGEQLRLRGGEGRGDQQEWHRVSVLGYQSQEDAGCWAGLQTQDPRAAHLGDMCQWELGRALQPKQGPHEVLRRREQVIGIVPGRLNDRCACVEGSTSTTSATQQSRRRKTPSSW